LNVRVAETFSSSRDEGAGSRGCLDEANRVYTCLCIRRRPRAIAKVFKSGNSQAVRLPKQFRLSADEVEIFRRGDEIVLRERPRDLGRAFDLLCALPEDVLASRGDGSPQERDEL
jgi:antitoxin VapB